MKSLTRPTFIKRAKGKEKKEIKPLRPKVKAKREKDFKMVKDFQKKVPICHKCGKIGHFANNCQIRVKINELQIDESIKEQIKEKLLMHCEGEENSDLYENSEEEEDPQIHQL